MRPLRERNNRKEIRLLETLKPLRGLRVLDVGAAHGWYLEAVGLEGACAVGVEPDARIADAARANGLQVTTGYFPEAVRDSPAFDVICFHDVLEHIADLSTALSACRRLLAPGGLLVVSAPDAGGALFAIARQAAVVGLYGPLERLWQVGYPSPHVSYFSRQSLDRIAGRYGFRRRANTPLGSLVLRGLWARVHMDRSPGLGSAVQFLGLVAAWALLWMLPSDQRLHVFELDPEA